MGFRPDLDLSGFIDDYRPWFGGKSLAGVSYVKTEAPERDINDFEPIPEAVLHRPVPRSVEEPLKVGNGPETATSVQDMVSAKPWFSWDVNGYYRLLGVPFPYVHATKGMLSKAYIAVDGQKSARKTYCLKQLLNPKIRAEYDAMPLGDVYLNDDYVQDAMKAAAAREAGKRTAAGTFTEAQAVMDEWGYKLVDESPSTDLDTVDADEDRDPRSPGFDPTEWTYAYWLWRSSRSDVERLAQWQSSVVTALSVLGARVRFAVGFLGRQPHNHLIGKAGDVWVVYVNDKLSPEYYPDASRLAARALLHDMSPTSTTHHPH